jgi:hypothetical protein
MAEKKIRNKRIRRKEILKDTEREMWKERTKMT